MLEFDDIQHILLTRTPAITGRYEFLSFDTAAGGRAWLSELIMENAPRSCRMSSAAMVSRLILLSAKATSSGMRGSR